MKANRLQNKASVLESVDAIERRLLMDAIHSRYGYDFSQYAKAAQRRRIDSVLTKYEIATISELQMRILHEPYFFDEILNELTITVTDFFRDPSVYTVLREKVLPYLQTYPHIKIWHAGCATGEEVYSMAILLKEANLYERCQIYATDINLAALEQAKCGVFSSQAIKRGAKNYFEMGGKYALHEYLTTHDDAVCIDDSLKKNIVFSDHNLVADQVFGEMHLILCRNVLIYFNQALQEKVLQLFTNSLIRRGYLCLGTKESLHFSAVKTVYRCIAQQEKVYQKVSAS